MMLSATMIATTVLYRERLRDTPYRQHAFPSSVETVMAADELTEFAGRSVHGSWVRDDPNTATNRRYLQRLLDLDQEHLFEHASATFWVTGASLALSAELREVAPYLHITEASLRYRSLDKVSSTIPAAVIHDEDMTSDYRDAFQEGREAAEDLDDELRSRGFPREAARDAAIGLLPLSTETTMLITADINSWLFVIHKSQAADTSAEFFTLGSEVLRQLRQIAPNALQDVDQGRRLRLVKPEPDEPVTSNGYGYRSSFSDVPSAVG